MSPALYMIGCDALSVDEFLNQAIAMSDTFCKISGGHRRHGHTLLPDAEERP